jgi:drug/metabolite transporter (DMT)-like permease
LNARVLGVSFPAMPPTGAQVASAAVHADAKSAEPRVSLLVAAFASVYVIWGSTYLAILWVIDSIPPLLMASGRFLFAGALLYGWMRARGAPRPTGAQWRAAAISGPLMLAGGNGAVVVAEQWVPSGVTALLVASVPLWMVALEPLFGSRSRPSRRVQVGLLVGFAGVAMLGGAPSGGGGTLAMLGALLVLCGCASWAAGSLYVRTAPAPKSPLVLVSMQMLTGGVVLGLMSLTLGEPARFDAGDVTLRSLLALMYLVIFGSLIAYSAYVWLLTVSTPARVGTYAYVNPVIALLLGWALAGEAIGLRSALAAAVIVGSVFVIVSEAKSASSRGKESGSNGQGGVPDQIGQER